MIITKNFCIVGIRYPSYSAAHSEYIVLFLGIINTFKYRSKDFGNSECIHNDTPAQIRRRMVSFNTTT